MGTLGLRAGVRLEIYAGLISKDLASIGIVAETGAYAQLWGYFYYSLYWDGETKKDHFPLRSYTCGSGHLS